MQKILLTAYFLLAAALLSAQTPVNTSVFFESDQYELSAEARQALDALALQLYTAPDYTVKIEAWTDDKGTQDYNLRLAGNRADAVQQYLAQKGLLLTKTTVRSWGEQNLAYDNSTEGNRRKNRRVDVAVTPYFFSDYAALQSRLAAPAEQTIRIQPGQEQTVTAANGTIIVVPANSFVFEDGTSPAEPVELVVREAFSPSDFVSHNLTTTSDGMVLQTGGMVYLGAQAGGKPLTLADGASLTVALPTGKVDPAMELFYGQINADNSINWQPARQTFRRQIRNPRVLLDIDPALSARIMALKVPVYPEPNLPKFSGELPPEPRKPSAPYEPRAPKKPTWENVQRMYGGGGYGAATNKLNKKELKKARKHYRKVLDIYERDSVNYVRLYNRYQINLENYKSALVKYDASLHNWKMEVQNRIRAIILFEREQEVHDFSLRLQKAIQRAGKNIHRYEYYSNLELAVGNAALGMRNTELREALMKGYGSGKLVSGLYDKYIGSKVLQSAGYSDLYLRAKVSCGADTTYRITDRLMKSSGITAISDSLKAEIREKRMSNASTTEQVSADLSAYVADVTRLGWINCDKFYKDPAEKVQLAVKEPEAANMYVICKDIGSILSLYDNGQGIYTANGLPKGKKVSVISIKLKDGVPQFASRDVKAGETGELNLEYRSMSLRDLREELKKLNI